MRAILAALILLSLVIVLRRGWVKLLGPVFFYDAIRSARRGRYFLVRTLYTGLILGLLCWTYFIWRLRWTVPFRSTSWRGLPSRSSTSFSACKSWRCSC